MSTTSGGVERVTGEMCIRCFKPQSDQRHDAKNPPPEGWHPFLGQVYLDSLEDALLFVRENNSEHKWEETGVIIDTMPSFPEKHCSVCGAINWGGRENGVCFGFGEAEKAVNAAHNRRAFKLHRARG